MQSCSPSPNFICNLFLWPNRFLTVSPSHDFLHTVLRIMEWLVAQCAFFAALETHLFHINNYFKSHNLCEVFPYHFSLRVASISEWVWSLKGPPQMRLREAEFSVKGQAVTCLLEDQLIFSGLLSLFLYLMLVIIPFWNAHPFSVYTLSLLICFTALVNPSVSIVP